MPAPTAAESVGSWFGAVDTSAMGTPSQANSQTVLPAAILPGLCERERSEQVTHAHRRARICPHEQSAGHGRRIRSRVSTTRSTSSSSSVGNNGRLRQRA